MKDLQREVRTSDNRLGTRFRVTSYHCLYFLCQRKFIWNHGAILRGFWHWYRTEAAMGTVGTKKMELYLLQIGLKTLLFCHCVFEQAGSKTEIQVGPRLSRSRSSQPVLKTRTFVTAWNTSWAVGALQTLIYRISSKQFWTRTKAKFVGTMSAQPGSEISLQNSHVNGCWAEHKAQMTNGQNWTWENVFTSCAWNGLKHRQWNRQGY